MPHITIYADSKSPRLTNCRSCGASISWAETTNGKQMPFDGPIVVIGIQATTLTDRRIELVDSAQSHFVTCPQATRWRR